MQGAKQGSVVSEFFAHTAEGREQHKFAHIREPALAELLRDRIHLVRDGGVLFGEIRMALAGVQDKEIHIVVVEGEVYGLVADTLGKVEENHAARRAGHLVHEAGCLVPPVVLGVLAHARIVRDAHLAVIVEGVQNGADQHLKRSRARDAGRRNDLARHIGAETADLVAELLRRLCDARDQRLRAVLLRGLRKYLGVDRDRAVAFAHNRDDAVVGRRCRADGVKRNAARQNFAAVVVRVIADNLRSAGRRKEAKLRRAEFLRVLFPQMLIAFSCPRALLAVERFQIRFCPVHSPFPLGLISRYCSHHSEFPFSFPALSESAVPASSAAREA